MCIISEYMCVCMFVGAAVSEWCIYDNHDDDNDGDDDVEVCNHEKENYYVGSYICGFLLLYL